METAGTGTHLDFLVGVLCVVECSGMVDGHADGLCVDFSLDTCSTLSHDLNDRCVDIIVNKHDAMSCRFYQFLHKTVGIENLAFEKDALYGWLIGADEKIDLLTVKLLLRFDLIYSLLLLIKTQIDLTLHGKKLLVDGIATQKIFLPDFDGFL